MDVILRLGTTDYHLPIQRIVMKIGMTQSIQETKSNYPGPTHMMWEKFLH